MKMKLTLLIAILALGQIMSPALAQNHRTRHHVVKHHRKAKNMITKLRVYRHNDHVVRQITPDPKKSPAKHADNLSKNVNHEINRESKDINHFFQGKKH